MIFSSVPHTTCIRNGSIFLTCRPFVRSARGTPRTRNPCKCNSIYNSLLQIENKILSHIRCAVATFVNAIASSFARVPVPVAAIRFACSRRYQLTAIWTIRAHISSDTDMCAIMLDNDNHSTFLPKRFGWFFDKSKR